MLRFPFRTPDQGLPPGDSSMRRHSVISLFVLVAAALAQPRAQTPAPQRSPATQAASRTPPAGRAPTISVVDPALLRGMQYRLVGPSRGGRVTAVTGVPSQPKTFYMGVASGGLFRTTDGGLNWAPITDGKVPLGSTGCVAVADSDPNVIYL